MPTKEVPVPEWGEGKTVRIRGLGTRGRLSWRLAVTKVDDPAYDGPEPTALLVSLTAIDDNGALLFGLHQVDALAELRGDVIERLAEAAVELSGLGDGPAEDAEGKSGADIPSGDSPSGSPAISVAPSPSLVSA